MAARGYFFTFLALVALGAPTWAGAQTPIPPAPPPKAPPAKIAPEITAFAKLYTEVQTVKEEYVAKFGRIHDPEGRKAWRDEYNAKLASILTNHAMTQQQYDDMIFKVSTDPESIAEFEVALKQASAG